MINLVVCTQNLKKKKNHSTKKPRTNLCRTSFTESLETDSDQGGRADGLWNLPFLADGFGAPRVGRQCLWEALGDTGWEALHTLPWES